MLSGVRSLESVSPSLCATISKAGGPGGSQESIDWFTEWKATALSFCSVDTITEIDSSRLGKAGQLRVLRTTLSFAPVAGCR